MTSIGFDQMVAVVNGLLIDQELLRLYEAGDRISRAQTKHDVAHAQAVMFAAQCIQDEVSRLLPGKLSMESRAVVIPAGAFFHDIGRAVDVDNHAQAGMKIAYDYLTQRNFPQELAAKIAAVVSCHRSEDLNKTPLESLKLFPELAIVVIADKCVGDEDRVRFWRALTLSILSRVGLAKLSLWRNSEHDRVNFAIKDSQILVDGDDHPSSENAGAIILKLKMDTSVASGENLLNLYSRRFQACDWAAKSMGFAFRVEVNGSRYFFDQQSSKWSLKETFAITLP
ncbi:MAG: HD domain-containing protein [Candidatus Melainabacteria bacterium]|nr:HD domain-containing protein [Candidatus Melainabacteria bacterium]